MMKFQYRCTRLTIVHKFNKMWYIYVNVELIHVSFRLAKFCLNIFEDIYSRKAYKQRGAVEACWAHNSEVGRSKLLAAMFFVSYALSKCCAIMRAILS